MSDLLNDIYKTLGRIEAEQTGMKDDIKEIKEGVADYKNTKNKLIGICVGVSTATGAGISAILSKMGIHL